jgi:curved DNA-binding protein CbpA
MDIKDYYKILEIEPVASVEEIKKAFHRLALKYHPDKNPGNAAASLQFAEIQEAYETLSNPREREEYNYKRWYNRSIGKDFLQNPTDAAMLSASAKQLADYVSAVNIFQLDQLSLSMYIHQLLNEETMALLQQQGNLELNNQILKLLLKAATPLPYNYALVVADKLRLLTNSNEDQLLLDRFLKQQHSLDWWKKYQLWVVIAATVLLCVLLASLS